MDLSERGEGRRSVQRRRRNSIYGHAQASGRKGIFPRWDGGKRQSNSFPGERGGPRRSALKRGERERMGRVARKPVVKENLCPLRNGARGEGREVGKRTGGGLVQDIYIDWSETAR